MLIKGAPTGGVRKCCKWRLEIEGFGCLRYAKQMRAPSCNMAIDSLECFAPRNGEILVCGERASDRRAKNFRYAKHKMRCCSLVLDPDMELGRNLMTRYGAFRRFR